MIEYTARITSQDTPRVGGRNLLLNSDKSLSNKEYYVGQYDISDPSLMVADEYYTIQIWGAAEGADYSESMWVYNSGGSTEVASIQKSENGVWQMTFKWRDDSKKLNSYLNLFRKVNHPNNKKSYNTTITRIKLERGTVATDWTPAPEDLDDSISTVNNSLTALASTLLDPEQGEIHKLTSQLESHKTDTDKNFEELSDHPLTIDQEGYWRIWNVKQQQYVTTQYQSRGDKGDTPVITLNDKYQLLADGKLVSAVSLKGRDGRNPSPEEVLGTSRFAELLGGEVTSQIVPVAQDLATTNSNITRASNYAIDLINETQHQLCDLKVLGMSDGGVIEVKRQASCVSYDYLTPSLGTETNPPQPPQPKYTTQQIPLTLRSSHDALSRQVSNLQVQLTSCTQQLTATKQELAQLKADTTITPVLNTDTRKRSGSTTLYPRYGDWLLTSDAEEQYISFSGLSAEVGRSIYIQTRKRAYLYSSGHSFYGLPGTSTQGNRWLSNNTTYRFVRADATTWLVTASSSPYPWT